MFEGWLSICSYGHFHINEFLMAARELLSSVGEAHSAWNSVNILNNRGINSVLVDLTAGKIMKPNHLPKKFVLNLRILNTINALVLLLVTQSVKRV